MAAITYENMTPTPITNAVVKKAFVDGVHKQYVIQAVDGYVLHDSELDYSTGIDEETNEMLPEVEGYTTGTVSCRYDYDFTANPRGFYAVLASSVPENSIFGGGDNDHEVMSNNDTETE